MVAGVNLLMEAVRVSKYSDAPTKRSQHVWLSGAGTSLVALGYAIAWAIKQAKGSSHFAAGHSLIRQAHAWGGWILLCFLCLQAVNGVIRQYGRTSVPAAVRTNATRLHNTTGPFLASSFAALLIAGMYMMLVEKPLAVDWVGTVLSYKASTFAVCVSLILLHAHVAIGGAGGVKYNGQGSTAPH
jgi:hypothetical protein